MTFSFFFKMVFSLFFNWQMHGAHTQWSERQQKNSCLHIVRYTLIPILEYLFVIQFRMTHLYVWKKWLERGGGRAVKLKIEVIVLNFHYCAHHANHRIIKSNIIFPIVHRKYLVCYVVNVCFHLLLTTLIFFVVASSLLPRSVFLTLWQR